ncbi:UDP-N-acetylmuramate dehydrogenase [Pedobacter deserti]|uniref:UDP-N-acetylmuramate dehydrogenase n=1 Tax=Pedobacter deserti TaxID=2817382 RepID=UPI00210A2C66|nr:UDP-N-acetylmuramate dehydrogenase [Pedobacter sp. SYSU D00382]
MRIYENFDLTNYNSYRITAFCSTAFFPETDEDVINLFKEHDKSELVLLGNGYNVILSQPCYEQKFIIFNGNFDCIRAVEDGVIEAECGSRMLDISLFALEQGLSGVEIFFDIPSSLGGAVVMNAGASGEEIKDVLMKVRYLDLQDLAVKEIQTEAAEFGYRNSFFQKNTDKIVLKAWLKLTPSSKTAIKEKMETIRAQRWAKQPKDLPNAGSVFKRPPGYYVGAMIDELGLKGFRVGGAMISEKHGGFVVNIDNATGRDILELIGEVQTKVYRQFGVLLEVEQRVI